MAGLRHDNELLLAEAVSRGVLADLTLAEAAAMCSAVTEESRSGDPQVARRFLRSKPKLRRRFEGLIDVADARVDAGGAVALPVLARRAAAAGVSGLEFFVGIPGSVGGGLLMNAGAFGGELSRVIAAISGVCRDGSLVRLPGETLGFAYRHTTLPPGLIVVEIEFRLRREQQENLGEALLRAQRKRQQTQPHGYPNAGSIFKNPPGTYAGQLIEAAGLKGLSWGRARVSEQHANFIVNTGKASAAEVRQLMEQVQQVVWEKSQVWLEPEVRLVGEW